MSGGGGGNPALEEEHVPHENHERYLLTYADMITLLLALFIVLFAISQVDQTKFNDFRAGLSAEFGNHNFDGGTGVLPGGESVESPMTPSDGSSSDIKALLEGAGMGASGAEGTGMTGLPEAATTTAPASAGPSPEPTDGTSAVGATTPVEGAEPGYASYGGHIDAAEGDELAGQLEESLLAQGVSIPDDARVIVDPERGVVIQLTTDEVTFESGSGTLTAAGRAALDTLVPALQAVDNPIEIEGHTDEVGTHDLNWDLSGVRAASAVKYLQNTHGIVPERLRYSGFGETQPIADNATPDGRRANRRVEVVIVVESATGPTSATTAAATGTSGSTAPSGSANLGTTATTTATTATPRATTTTRSTTATIGSSSGPSSSGPGATVGIVLQPGELARQATSS
jgi:chemotaxis protein MotB